MKAVLIEKSTPKVETSTEIHFSIFFGCYSCWVYAGLIFYKIRHFTLSSVFLGKPIAILWNDKWREYFLDVIKWRRLEESFAIARKRCYYCIDSWSRCYILINRRQNFDKKWRLSREAFYFKYSAIAPSEISATFPDFIIKRTRWKCDWRSFFFLSEMSFESVALPMFHGFNCTTTHRYYSQYILEGLV